MNPPRHLKILHVLGQRPDATGSGIYLQAMMREAVVSGHENYMIAGIQSNRVAAWCTSTGRICPSGFPA